MSPLFRKAWFTTALLLLSLCLSATAAEWTVLRAGVVTRAPYAHYDPATRMLSGPDVNLLERLGQDLNIHWQWRSYPTVAALEAALAAHEVDVAPGLLQTPRGLRTNLYTDPYLRVQTKLIARRDFTGRTELGLLVSTRISMPLDGPLDRFFRDNYPALDRIGAANDTQALQQVLRGEVVMAVLDQAQATVRLRDPTYAGLRVVGDVGYPYLLRIASRADLPDLNRRLDAALRNLPAPLLERWYGPWLIQRDGGAWSTIGPWRQLVVICLLLALGAAGLAFWYRHQRGQLETALQAARTELDAHHRSEAALRLPQFSLDQSTVGIVWLNWDGRIRYANPAAGAMYGLQAGALMGRPYADFDPAIDMDGWLRLWNRLRQSDSEHSETEHRRADGSLFPVDVTLSFLRFRDGDCLVAFVADITERRRVRRALEESEARLKGIAGNVPGVVFQLERPSQGGEVRLAYLSEASFGMLGYTPDEIRARELHLGALVHPDDRDPYRNSWDAAEQLNADWHWQGRVLTDDDQIRWTDLKATVRWLPDGSTVWDGILWDITENKRNELSLAESRAMLRDLSAHLESVREEEKARIAREVHDELGQVLTGLKLEASMAEFAFAPANPGLSERISTMKKLIDQTIQIVRNVATALRPPVLDLGLPSALEWLARRFEARYAISCAVTASAEAGQLPDGTATGLFRIVQEALTNVARHAEATSVRIDLHLDATALMLSVVDDGRGFDPQSVQPGRSFGLIGIRERVLMLGGTLVIDSRPGAGTTLTVDIPLMEHKP